MSVSYMKRVLALCLTALVLLPSMTLANGGNTPIYGPNGEVLKMVEKAAVGGAQRMAREAVNMMDELGAVAKRVGGWVAGLAMAHQVTASQVQAQHSMWASMGRWRSSGRGGVPYMQ